MKFDPFELVYGLNIDLYLEWIQCLDRCFDIKEYSYEKAFKVVDLKMNKYVSLWYENTRRQKR